MTDAHPLETPPRPRPHHPRLRRHRGSGLRPRFSASVFLDRLEDDMARQAHQYAAVLEAAAETGRRHRAAGGQRRRHSAGPHREAGDAGEVRFTLIARRRHGAGRLGSRSRHSGQPRRPAGGGSGSGRERGSGAPPVRHPGAGGGLRGRPAPRERSGLVGGRAARRPAGRAHRRDAGGLVADPLDRVGDPSPADAGRRLLPHPLHHQADRAAAAHDRAGGRR